MKAVQHLEVLVEEPSMESALRALLPKLLGRITFSVRSYEGKHSLLRRLPQRLAGYAKFLPEGWRILIVVDRDSDLCDELAGQIDKYATQAGLIPRRRDKKPKSDWQVANRIAIEELEAWYFGDWEAVCSAYPKMNRNVVKQAAYRKPDEIAGGTWEALEREMQKRGYFRNGLRKIEAATEIAKHMDPNKNESPSFQALTNLLAELAIP